MPKRGCYEAAADPTLRERAEGFWDLDKSQCLKGRRGRRPGAIGYAEHGNACTENQALPFLGDMRLDTLAEAEVENRLAGFEDRGLSNGTANNAHKMPGIMPGFACKQRVVKSNPCLFVEKLKAEGKEIKILTFRELRALFPDRRADARDDHACHATEGMEERYTHFDPTEFLEGMEPGTNRWSLLIKT
jgi:hypothetical protein